MIKNWQQFNESFDFFSDEKLKELFFDTFTHPESEIDIHINNKEFNIFIDNGLLRNAGQSASDRIVLRLTNKGKDLLKNKNIQI